ncbi:glutathione-disulfide reductase [Roseicitreum antarcticum]|uniref:NADPH-glutathione reductase n=1 Tax=Roseicitreum antarcticum TaxID=564137 RepID=A0A1H2SFE4_9RHOB|nr:glutathione-disulfide reductase [Roseicitreum antarcticum]SDW30265.1 NADPH-glutathione reductase [Roseicitreum antarcticum]
MTFDYDLFVIGGGSGGVRAARIASGSHGAKVALAEEYRMGGTCVIRGCVPKKLMVFASAFPGAVDDANVYGWDAQINAFDWRAFSTRMHRELDRLEGIYRTNLEKAGVTLFDCRATVAGPHTVRLADGQEVSAKHILLATGGRAFIPDKWAEAGCMTSNEVFLMQSLPESVLIIGGGYIASEFACIFNGLGVQTSQFYRGAQILRGFDEEVRGHVSDAMIANGVELHLGADILEMEKRDGQTWVKSTTGHEALYDAVIFATGRIPNSDGLGLEELGLTLSANGAIPVDDYSQTAVPSVYAVGDVTDRVNLTPVAIREGHSFADTVFGGTPRKVDHALIASAVFTQPEIGTIGLSEEAASAAGPVDVYCASFRPMHRAFAGREDRVLMKLLVCKRTDKVLGCHIVADGAGEMIQLAAIAIGMGATKADFDRTMAVHPTMAEELVTMRAPLRSAGQ